MICPFWFQLVAVLLYTIVFAEDARHVTVPDVYAVTGGDATIKCYVKFAASDNFSQETITFEMINSTLKCHINEPKTCSPFYLDYGTKPNDFSCGCLSQTDETRFIFYLYLHACQKVRDKTRYQCTLSSANPLRSDGQLKLIDFSKRPMSTVTKCEGESVQFPWEYNPSDYQNKFVIHHITWMFYPVEGKPSRIGSFDENMVYSSDMEYFGDRASVYKVALKETIPQLMVTSLHASDTGIFQIEITFLSERALRRHNEGLKGWHLNETIDFSMENHTTGDKPGSFLGRHYDEQSVSYDDADLATGDEDGNPNKKMFTKREDGGDTDFWDDKEEIYDSENMTISLADYLRTVQPVLRSTVMLYIVEPPPANLTLVFKVLSRSHETFLYCSVLSFRNETSFAHISFVIKHDETILGTSSNESSLLLQINRESPTDNYFCEMTGEAFRCANKRPKNSSRTLYISNLLKFEKVSPQVAVPFTFMEVIFIVEGVLCVFLMIWNCNLIIWHLSFLSSRRVKREERKLSNALEELEVTHMRRLSRIQALRRHPNLWLDNITTASITEPTTAAADESTSVDLSTFTQLSTDDQDVTVSSLQEKSRSSQNYKILAKK